MLGKIYKTKDNTFIISAITEWINVTKMIVKTAAVLYQPVFIGKFVRSLTKKACLFSTCFSFAVVLTGGMTGIPVRGNALPVRPATEIIEPSKAVPADDGVEKAKDETNATAGPKASVAVNTKGLGNAAHKTETRDSGSSDGAKADVAAAGKASDKAADKKAPIDKAAESLREQERIAGQSDDEYEAEQALAKKEGISKKSEETAKTDEAGLVQTGAMGWLQPENASVASKPGGFVYSDIVPMSRELQAYTYEKCVEQGLEYQLVLAIIWCESRFNTDAVNINANGTKDSGMMQINDVNKGWLNERYGINNLMDPYQNIDAGTTMLGGFTQKYGSHYALMAYQYGEGGMKRQIAKGNTTNNLIKMVYRQRDYYRQFI